MMLPAFTLIAQGIQIHVAAWPWYRMGGPPTFGALRLAQATVIQGSTYVISVGAAYRKENLPDELADLHFEQVLDNAGGSAIIDPWGNVIAQVEGNEDTILVAEGTTGTLDVSKSWKDLGGHYARPDVFRLHVDRRPLRPLEVSDVEQADTEATPEIVI